MLGYYEDEEATKEVMTEDGYFRSGDIGYVDDEGFVYVTGRTKNVIVTQNGKNIYPEEIEMLLDKIPEIKEVMVYGKSPEEDDKRRNDKELIITARVIPDMDELDKIKPNMTKEEIHQVIWEKIKEVNEEMKVRKEKKDRLRQNKEKFDKELKEKEKELEKLTSKLSKKELEIEAHKQKVEKNTDKKYDLQSTKTIQKDKDRLIKRFNLIFQN